MFLLLVIGKYTIEDGSAIVDVYIDRYVIKIFEFRNAFKRYRKFDIREIHRMMQIRRFSVHMIFSQI